jgi:hypothetical protein
LDAGGEGIAGTVGNVGKLVGEGFGFGVREFKLLHDR